MVVFVFAAFCANARAAEVSLIWDQSVDESAVGYKIYYGFSPRNYQYSKTVGANNFTTLENLSNNAYYYFSVVAYDSLGRESSFSNEIKIKFGNPQSSPPEVNKDTDGDGIFDKDEARYGTDVNNADTDGDGVNDGQEVLDGSNPIDRGSYLDHLGKYLCTEWNGYLDGLWNILELVNVSNQQLTGNVYIFTRQGQIAGQRTMSILPGAQFDLLIHEEQSIERNSYGLVCVQHNGSDGALDGRMMYYRGGPRPFVGEKVFDFAFAVPLTSGQKGVHVVPFNTYQPSPLAADQNNLVANWIQITNLGKDTAHGLIKFYGLGGELLNQQSLMIHPRERFDIGAHDFGVNQAGFVEWVPVNKNASISMRNVRYLYDNPHGADSFATAFQLDAQLGNGQLLSVPLMRVDETSVLEISNTKSFPVTATVRIYNEAGRSVFAQGIELEAKQSRHIIVDDFLVPGSRGLATIKGSHKGSIAAVSMHYGRRADGGISYMYGLPAQQSLGSVLKSSYNTHLAQTDELIVANPTKFEQYFNVSLVRSDGTIAANGLSFSVPARSVKKIRLNDFELPDSYGVVSVLPNNPNSLSAYVLRKRANEYVVPTVLR